MNPLTAKVGNLGTSPVTKYSINIGKNNVPAVISNNKDSQPKKCNGL